MVRRLTLTDEKTINLAKNLSTLDGYEDEKDVIKEAVLLLWEKRGGELISSLSKISPVAKFLNSSENNESSESEIRQEVQSPDSSGNFQIPSEPE